MLTSLSALLLLLLFPLVHPFLPFSIFRFVYDASFLVDVADADYDCDAISLLLSLSPLLTRPPCTAAAAATSLPLPLHFLFLFLNGGL